MTKRDRWSRLAQLLRRAVRLRCPYCGQARIYRGWWSMHRQCPACGQSLEREPGFYLGSIYLNYGLTTLILAVVYPILLFHGVASNQVLLAGSLVFCLVFPLWFHRYARSLWLALDEWFDPHEAKP